MNKNNWLIIIIISILFSLSISWQMEGSRIINFIIFSLLSCFIIYNLKGKILSLKLSKTNNKMSKKEYLIYTIIIIIPLLISLLSYYPGIATTDTITQWNQVQSNIYNNWHPVLHTLIFMKLPSMICNNFISATTFQLAVIFIILLYFCYVCRKYFLNFSKTIFVLLLIVLNPIFLRYSVTIWKDLPYSWFIFLNTLNLIEISLTNGEWLNKKTNKLFFILSSVGILIFRHNGIIPFACLFIFLIIFYNKYRKFLITAFCSIIIVNVVITGPVYNHFNIDAKTGGKSEMTGVVMSQISYYYNNNVSFSKDEVELLNYIGDIDIWKNKYNPSSFNSIKWSIPDYNSKIDLKFNEIMKLWFNKSLHNPYKFFVSFLNITYPIWKTENTLDEVPLSDSINYETAITSKGNLRQVSNTIFEHLISYNNIIQNSPLRWLFTSIGQGLLLIICALVLTLKKCKWNLKNLAPYVPVLINTAVIMLLITGWELRFVYAQSICVVPLILYSLSNYHKDKKDSKLKLFLTKLFKGKTEDTLIQFIRYIFVGGIAAVVNIGMLYIFTELFHIYYIVSNILSFILGLVVNYILSKKMVFQEETSISKSKEFAIYAIIGVIGLGLDTLLVWLFTDIFNIYYMLSKLISTMLVFIWNFVARKILYKVIK